MTYQGPIDELKEQVVRLHIQSGSDLTELLNDRRVLSHQISGEQARITVKDVSQVLLTQWQQQFSANIKVETLSLEDIFLELNACKLI